MREAISRRAALAAASGWPFLGALGAVLGGASASAAGRALAEGPALSGADQETLARALSYIQALTSVEGRFRQTDAKGSASSGAFFLERPGRARFQYDPPSGLLVVSDGDQVSVFDRRLKSFDQYPLEQTPLALLLGDTSDWRRSVEVTAIRRQAGEIAIDAEAAGHRTPGRLSLLFSDAPLTLRGWTIVDAQRQATEVRLTSLRRVRRLDPSLFVLTAPNKDSG